MAEQHHDHAEHPAHFDCPRCGGDAEILPAGQNQPTIAEAYSSCWVHADGSQPGEPPRRDGRGILCSRERSLEAGLITRLLDCTTENGVDRLSPEDAAQVGRDGLVLRFLRFARQHPLVSAEMALLLLDRLKDLRLTPHPNDPRDGDQSRRAFLTLQLRGRGATAALLSRHHKELQALLADLLDGGDGLDDAWWFPGPEPSGRWECGERFLVALVCLEEGLADGRALLWPGLQEVSDG